MNHVPIINSNAETGKQIRLARIISSDRPTLMVPLDDALITGPTGQLGSTADLIRDLERCGCDSALAFQGTLRHIPPNMRIGRVLNVTASTVRYSHTQKVVSSTVDQALRLGADGVAVHVNVSSRYEPEMLSSLGRIADAADRVGMPVLGIMYPRSETEDGDNNYESLRAEDPERFADLVAHACRIGQELGADIIKTQFTGTTESFSRVVKGCEPLPVLVAGSRLTDLEKVLALANGALDAGAAGISFGRNIHQRISSGNTLLQLLAKIFRGQETFESAKRQLANDTGEQ